MDTMSSRGTRGAYRREDRVALPPELQKELVEKAAAKHGNCQELAKALDIPKSSVHYYRINRLTMPESLLERMLQIAADEQLEEKIRNRGITKDRTWANEYSSSIHREMCRDRLRLPTRDELERDDELRRKAAAIVSYIMAEGSIWLQKEEWGECAVNITFAAHETDLYEHFRSLCKDVFLYDIGPPQEPGNGAAAIRGFIYSRFVAEWMIANGVMPGDKSSRALHLPQWIMQSDDALTWIAAIQPWCDGEGSARSSNNGSRSKSFTIAQSRHTNLDTNRIPHALAHRVHGYVRRSLLDRVFVHGVVATEYLRVNCRSEIFDDVSILLSRIGLSPKMDVDRVFMKDDGYWSCIWIMHFGNKDARRLPSLGLVTQVHKRTVLLAQ